MFEFWKDLFRPIRKRDPRFGSLRYLRDARMWEGNQHFAPVGHEVEVIVFGEAGGPTAGQHAFFDALAARYEGLWPAIRGLLQALRESMDPESDVAGAIGGVLEDDSRLDASTSALIRFVDQAVCRNQVISS